MARADWRVEPLTKAHDRRRFDCGEPSLDEYLARHARQNHESGIARTFVAVSGERPARILGYSSLTVGGIDQALLPPGATKRFPNFPVPVARIARLAVDRSVQGQGLGEHLLVHAFTRCLEVSHHVGIVAVLVDAKNEAARRFYERYEFESLPDQPLTLWLPISELRSLLGSR